MALQGSPTAINGATIVKVAAPTAAAAANAMSRRRRDVNWRRRKGSVPDMSRTR
jgi:hypothetical protein